MTRRFPDAFVFGAATASYQIEGAVAEDGRGPSVWDTFSATPGRVHHGDTGAIATDHYHRWADDLDLLRDLGLTTYRFSVAWPRIQPTGRGAVNQKGLDFYRQLAEGLNERGITPAATLFHWDLPQGLQDEGGFASRDTVSRYVDYVTIVTEALGDVIPRWITFNEPWVYAFLGHSLGTHAPGITDESAAFAVAHHQLLAHGLAAPEIRRAAPGSEVAITLNLTVGVPVSDTPADRAAADRKKTHQNRLFLDPILTGAYHSDVQQWYAANFASVVHDGDLAAIVAPIDWLGVNYYMRSHVRHVDEDASTPLGFLNQEAVVPPWLPITAMGWPVEGDGLRELLVGLRDDYASLPPVYITENGAAYHDYVDPEGAVDDVERIAYLQQHLAGVLDAIEAGVDVRGYYLWSLIDNFEWAEGYNKRFGIIFVDYLTQTRTPKQSAHWYSALARTHELPDA